MSEKDGKTLSIFGSHNVRIFNAVHKANRRSRIGNMLLKVFPTSASEAKRPQRIVKGPEK
jgi:hypothetical protein